MLRMRRILLDVLAKTNHEIIDGSRVGVLAQSPDLSQNRLARYDLSAVANEMAQQLGLHHRQMEGLAVSPQLQSPEVHLFLGKGVYIKLSQQIGILGFGHPRLRRW